MKRKHLFIILILIGAAELLLVSWKLFSDTPHAASIGFAAPASETAVTLGYSTEPTAGSVSEPASPNLPEESAFLLAAENTSLKLWVHEKTAHFKIESKQSGAVWRSYPDPKHWEQETISGTWKHILLSPVMLEYIDASNAKSQSKLTSWTEEKGVHEGFELTESGFRTTFRFPKTRFLIPIEVVLADDYVETKVLDSGIREDRLSLLNLKLYPSFGAQPYTGQEGYLLVPDGSGALIHFKENQSSDKPVYRENVYGPDLSYYNENTSRKPVSMPVFGIKSGEQAFAAVLTEGAEYAKIFAAPGGSLGQANWAAAEWQYRIKFFQSTNKQGSEGFYTYSKERFTLPERSLRYYPLEGERSNYAGMAAKYRSYLMKEFKLDRQKPAGASIPFVVDIIGADRQKGALWDDYIPGTTTDEAAQMIKRLRDGGIEQLIVQYAGFQRWGYSSHGGLMPVDDRIGGNEGMKQFIDFAHSLNVPVFLTADYSINNNGRGFWSLSGGLRNLAGTLQQYRNYVSNEDITVVSPLLAASTAQSDLAQYQELGADGILFQGGIGSGLNTDFNSRYAASRHEVLQSQTQLLSQTKEVLGSVSVEQGSFYSLGSAQLIHRLADDYSYDIFIDEAVPFAQITLHGLVSYTSNWSNLRDEYKNEMLRSIEYGAYPTYVFTGAASGAFKNAYSIWYYSMDYREWEQAASEEYKIVNGALKDVQDQFIAEHRTVAPGVKETVYENGVRIIVNYNSKAAVYDGIHVPAENFVVRKEG